VSYSTLISTRELQSLLASEHPTVILDCSFDLTDAGAGERAHAAAHLPGAHYVHLDRDLSGIKTGRNGRHPLPDRQAWAGKVGNWGIAPAIQVVCYDAQGGPYAARAWWLLRWLGHSQVAVLDGGISAWTRAGGATASQAFDEYNAQAQAQAQAQAPYPAAAQPAMPSIDAGSLLARLGTLTVLDARAGERFRGEVEPLDPVAGHIPGAKLRFFKDNLQADGRFKPAEVLRAEFAALGADQGEVVNQCGSGVTACHNLLAAAHAGLAIGTLYPGSWSEWCSDPSRPVAKG